MIVVPAASAGRVSLLGRGRGMCEVEGNIHSKPTNFPLAASTPVCSSRMSQPIEKSKTSSEIFLRTRLAQRRESRLDAEACRRVLIVSDQKQLVCRQNTIDLRSTSIESTRDATRRQSERIGPLSVFAADIHARLPIRLIETPTWQHARWARLQDQSVPLTRNETDDRLILVAASWPLPQSLNAPESDGSPSPQALMSVTQ